MSSPIVLQESGGDVMCGMIDYGGARLKIKTPERRVKDGGERGWAVRISRT